MNLAQKEQLEQNLRELRWLWDVILKDFFIIIWFWACIWLVAYFLL